MPDTIGQDETAEIKAYQRTTAHAWLSSFFRSKNDGYDSPYGSNLIETTDCSIDDDMHNAREMLQRFADSANKSQLRPIDYMRFCDASIYIHQHGIHFTGPQMRTFLYACGFSADMALRLGIQYERYRELLAQATDPLEQLKQMR